jgi:PAT family acetyl-CoA transporter-like MFS transporter 1
MEKNTGPLAVNNNENTESNEERRSMLKDLDGDKMHVLVLFFLYILQGIPLGLKDAIPLILTNRNVPYSQQATYSISSYPFSMKILWAPLVDSLYIARFGRRKSWLVPVQYLIGEYKINFSELQFCIPKLQEAGMSNM